MTVFKSAAATLLVALSFAHPAAADTIVLETSLFSAQGNSGTTPIAANDGSIAGLANGYQTDFAGTGYTVSFSGLANGYGLRNDGSGLGAVPVAGVQGGNPTYLTGDFGSATTTNKSNAGYYFTTGQTGSGGGNTSGNGITVTFDHTIHYITLLWGSVDLQNLVTLFNGATLAGSVTGAQVQASTAGFAGNGFQGAGGSVYVQLYDAAGFDSVFFSSGVNSFEFAGIAGSPFYQQIPEPASIAALAAGLFALGLVRRARA